MRYLDLRNKLSAIPLLRLEDLRPFGKFLAHEPVQLSRWVQKGLLIRLRKGLYALPDQDRKSGLSPLWLANQLYFPSYISLEFVLSQAGLIPEAVGAITCVTPRKTKAFSNIYGQFLYKKIKPDFFFGFKTFQNAGQSFFMAYPEKAVLDFLYLAVPKSAAPDERLFLQNYRFQNLEQLNVKRFKEFLSRFSHPRVEKAGEIFLKLIRGAS